MLVCGLGWLKWKWNATTSNGVFQVRILGLRGEKLRDKKVMEQSNVSTFNILRENILRLVWFKEHLKTDGSKGFTLLKTRKTTFSIGSSSSFEYDKVVEISLMTLLTLLRIF